MYWFLIVSLCTITFAKERLNGTYVWEDDPLNVNEVAPPFNFSLWDGLLKDYVKYSKPFLSFVPNPRQRFRN